MNLRIHLVAIAITWATAVGSCLLIKHELWVFALLLFVLYCCAFLAIAFKLEALDSVPPFRLIGSREKSDRYQDYQ